ncbi:MAG: CHAT domain-containing protein [Bacteroidetes bacterium]|nr:MAG: CHAT domain-containing protein [Bacteroidota bacterium]
MRTILFLITFVLFSIYLNAQSLKELMTNVDSAISKQDYQNALLWAEKAKNEAINKYGNTDSNFVSVIKKFVEINFALKNYYQALDYAKLDSTKTQIINGTNSISYAETLLNLAQIYLYLQRYNEAENTALKSTELFKKLLSQYDPKYANALKALAWIYSAENKGIEASQTYFKILQSIKENYGIMNDAYAENVSNVSQALESKELYSDAEEFLLHVINEYNEKGVVKSDNYAKACLDLGRIYAKSGRESESEGLLKYGLQYLIQKSGDNNLFIMSNYNFLAYDYSLTNKYDESENLYKKLLIFYKQYYGENSSEFASLLNRISILYKSMNRFDESEEYSKQSIDILKNLKLEKTYLYSIHLNSLADVYMNKGKFEDCLQLYDECENIYKSLYGDEYPDRPMLMNNRAEIYKNLGRYKEAEILLQNSLMLIEKKSGRFNYRYAVYLNNLAEVLEFEGYYSIADSLYKEVLNLKKAYRGEFHSEFAETICMLARLHEKIGNYDLASKYFQQAMNIYIRNINLIFPTLNDNDRRYFIAPFNGFFEHFCSYLSKSSGDNNEMTGEFYNYRIRTKSLLFNFHKKIRENILKSGDSSLVKSFQVWQNLRYEIARYYNFSSEVLEKRGINFDSLNNSANEIEKEISNKSEDFGIELQKKDYKWEEIRDKLNNDEAAVEIIRFRIFGDIKNSNNPSVNIPGFFDSVAYAALIITKDTKKSPKMVLLKNGNQIENNLATLYTNTLQKLKDNTNNPDKEIQTAVSEKILSNIYNNIWKNINKQLKKIKTVYLSTDGIFNKININTLFNPDTKKYVIEDLDIRFVTNTSDIINFKSKNSGIEPNAYLFSNPQYNLEKDSLEVIAREYKSIRKNEINELSSEVDSLLKVGISPYPESESGIKFISEKLKAKGWNIHEFTGASAIEEAVKSVQYPRVLHLATQGLFLKDIDANIKRTSGMQIIQYPENPLLRSFLIFSGINNINKNLNGHSNIDDGILTTYEIMNLNLDSTELVVLSDCETGIGEIKNDNSITNMQNAFQSAGAKSIIMSLWKINNEPKQEFLNIFYDNWLSGKSKREAFRQTQLTLKEKYNNIYSWGGFLLIGE